MPDSASRYLSNPFAARHLGPSDEQAAAMLEQISFPGEDLINAIVPEAILDRSPMQLPPAIGESEALSELRAILSRNTLVKSLIGCGFSNTITPPVLQRCVLENPGWYTAYTPYQAEISQGRMEMLLNFQTLITDLTALDVANASLLDEATAVAEAVSLAAASKPTATTAFIAETCHPHVIDVLRTRTTAAGIKLVVGDPRALDPAEIDGLFAVVLSYPDTLGAATDWTETITKIHEAGALAIVCADLLALCLLKPPGEMGADICVGNSQRFGVPLGYGGPHAAFMAVKDNLKRKLPGRLIGVSVDSHGAPAFRLSLQTREQHIRREKATSNICTAQVLLAVMAAGYACYHGPQGLRQIARRVHDLTRVAAAALTKAGFSLQTEDRFFDTLTVSVPNAEATMRRAREAGFNLRRIDSQRVGIALDETTTGEDIELLLACFDVRAEAVGDPTSSAPVLPDALVRRSDFLAHPVFNSYHTETEMLRYLRRLQGKDIALDHSMIALGSCTMKLNAAAEMMPLSWPEVGGMHPFAPAEQAAGYHEMFAQLESWLASITGFAGISLQPNAGSQGEYAGLLAIRRYHEDRGEAHRDVCLIPSSAHGTNPASAVMCSFKVVAVGCTKTGDIDIDDLRSKVEEHRENLGALMITYPSTHGVFEEGIREICALVHGAGGQVYMDGANMNAQVGLTSPGRIGADVCHLNLHKTFCIPHGGGGPGVGPIGVAPHLVAYLPGHELLGSSEGAVCSAPWGSASICTISWMYIRMMGDAGLRKATATAIINANYVATRLKPHFPVLYTGKNGLVAHECIIDLRHHEHVGVEDIAKRLIDYGYHAPTMSWPVAGTLMIEPTESESQVELDRFCDAMIAIREEIREVEEGRSDPNDNPLKNAPHTAASLLATEWKHPYTREQAAYPLACLRQNKYWPPVGRIDNVHGDRNLVCSCAGMADYET
jgi:glycine dehydrogenase